MVSWVGITLLSGMTNRLTMSSNTVWVRPQLMFGSLNKLMWGFGKLTLKPASFSLFFLFLYFYFSSSSMSVNARSFHIQHTQNNDETHWYYTRITYDFILNKNKQNNPFFSSKNLHLTGRATGWSCRLRWDKCVLNWKFFCFCTSLEKTQKTTFFLWMITCTSLRLWNAYHIVLNGASACWTF